MYMRARPQTNRVHAFRALAYIIHMCMCVECARIWINKAQIAHSLRNWERKVSGYAVYWYMQRVISLCKLFKFNRKCAWRHGIILSVANAVGTTITHDGGSLCKNSTLRTLLEFRGTYIHRIRMVLYTRHYSCIVAVTLLSQCKASGRGYSLWSTHI